MGVRAVLRAAQQALPKRIASLFSSDFSGSSISGDVYSTTTKRKWSFLRGTWGISSSKLTTSTASSSYPITVIDALVPDVKIELKDIGQGVGAAIWVTDAGNWWAVAPQQQSEDCNCQGYYYDCNCTTYSYSCGCSTCTGYYCSSYNCGCGNGGYGPLECRYIPPAYCTIQECTTRYGNYCSAYYANGNCRSYTQISWLDCVCSGYEPGYEICWRDYIEETYDCCCSQSYEYSCGCSTCYDTSCSTCYGTSCQTCYPQYMRIIQSAANTVSEVVKWQVSNIVRSIKVMTSNKNITVESFSDASMSNKIDTVSHNATSASETTKFGIVVSPSSYNESKTVSEINIERGV